MTKQNPGWHKVVLDEDDAPELTAERASELRPAGEALPESVLNQFKRSPGRPHWRAQGPGWQSGIKAALRRASGL